MDITLELDKKLQEAAEKWGSQNLLNIWFILQTPSFNDNGDEYIEQADIVQLRELCLKVKDEITQREKKANDLELLRLISSSHYATNEMATQIKEHLKTD